MIETNLLPEELKPKAKKINLALAWPMYLLGIIAILVCLHLYLAIGCLIKHRQLGLLEKKWQAMEPERKALEAFNKKYLGAGADASRVEGSLRKRIIWARNLNSLSLSLPSGVWLRALSISGCKFILSGSAVSLQREELNLIKKFIDNLSNEAPFFKNFEALEITSTQRREFGGYDIMDFILTGRIKTQ